MNLYLVRNIIFTLLLFLVSFKDFKTYKISNKYIEAIIGNWVLSLSFHEVGLMGGIPLAQFCKIILEDVGKGLAAGMAVGGLVLAVSIIFDYLLQKKSLGGGDIKLIFAVSLYLGMDRSFYMLFIACILGLLMILTRQKNDGKRGISFGPAIAASTILMLFFP